MKRIAIPMILACALAGCATTTPGSLRTTALTGNEAAKALKQCSRPSPAFDSIRALSSSNVRLVNASLGQLALMKDSNGRGIRPLQEYVFQYVGIMEQGVPKVYVNAVMPPPDQIIWQTQALLLCDGGDRAFGATFNPATQTYSDFQVNGSYAGSR